MTSGPAPERRAARSGESANALWTDDELASSVEAYIFMLRLERAGLLYRKEAASNVLLAGPLHLRNDAAIRYRMRNISAVVHELGGPVLSAYSPAEQVGRNVRERLRALLSRNPGFQQIMAGSGDVERAFQNLPDTRLSALGRLAALQDYIADLEREHLGVGHNNPPEPISTDGPAREDFERAREAIRSLEEEVNKPHSQLGDIEEPVRRLLDFALKIGLWTGARLTKFTDAALAVFAPILIVKATGLLPVMIDAVAAVLQTVTR